MRNRLIELHRRARQAYFKYIGDMQTKARDKKLTEAEFNQIMDNICSEQEFTADYLIANGVIVPPCKVGNTVYYIDINGIKPQVEEVLIREIITTQGENIFFRLCDTEFVRYANVDIVVNENEIGRTIFVGDNAKQEAEKALAEMRG